MAGRKGQMANPTSASNRNSPNRRANANRSASGGTMTGATTVRFPETGSKTSPPHVKRGGDMGAMPRTTVKVAKGTTVPGAGNSK